MTVSSSTSSPPERANDELAALRAAVEREVRASPRRPWWHDVSRIVAVQVGIVVLVIGAWAIVLDVHSAWTWSGALLVASLVAGTVAAVMPSGRHTSWAALVVVIGLALPAAFAAPTRPHALTVFGPVDCALAEIGASLLPAVACMIALRRFMASTPRMILAGLVSGVTGLLVLDRTCPIGQTLHAAAYHVLPCLAVVVVFVLVRARSRSKTFAP